MLTPGTLLGHYRIVEEIGKGGMGVVYRARDERLERDVAIKILPAGALTDEAARKRFRQEALALSKLNHPNLATVHDFDTQARTGQEGTDFLVMEYIAGETLSEKLAPALHRYGAGPGPLPEKEVVRLGQQLAEGLAAAHAQGVIHRDLKPGNLRLMPDGRLKILDFGLAKLLRPAAELGTATTESLTETQAAAGTLPYMAPEQLRGEPVDARTDLWAAGAVLYELATGRRPFREELSTRLIEAITHQPVVSPRALNPRVSAELERIILKCLDKEPEHRYQSARELAADFRRLIQAPTVPAPSPGAPAPGTLLPRRWVAALALLAIPGLVVVVLLALNVWGLRERLLGGVARPRIQSLAVLPLENLSADPAQDYFADGMTEALITDLAKIGALKVISRTSVMQYKGAKKPLPQIAKELNVDAVVEGSVQRAGNRVRITAQLVDAATDRHLWAENYDRELGDILALSSEVARAIAAQIRVQLTAQEQQHLAGAARVRPEAYEAYLRGRFTFQAHERAAERNLAAVRWFERAVELDPDFALAHAGLARAYVSRFFSHDPGREWEEKAYIHMGKALALDPNLAEAYVARGDLTWTLANRFPHERALQEYKRALALNPNLPDAHFALGSVYLHIGLLDKAREHLRAAISLDPLRPDARIRIPRVYLYQQDYAAALAEFERDPDFPLLWQWQKALALFYLKRNQEALALLERIRQEHPRQDDVASAYAVLLAGMSQPQKAEEQIQIAIENGEGKSHFHHAQYNIASAYALLGEKRLALEWLKKTADDGMPCYPLFASDPNLHPLRGDPQFRAFLEGMRVRWEHYQATL